MNETTIEHFISALIDANPQSPWIRTSYSRFITDIDKHKTLLLNPSEEGVA